MLRNPRVWLWAAAGWLAAGAALHVYAHVSTFVLEQGLLGQREFAMRAMKQAVSADAPLQPDMWRLMAAYSGGLGLLLLFAAAVTGLMAWLPAPSRVLRAFALVSTVFWTASFGFYAFVAPVMVPLLVSAGAAALCGTTWLAAAAADLAETLRHPDQDDGATS